MKIIHNKWIPFGRFGAMNVLGFLFTKIAPEKLSMKTLRHEQIHTQQQYEIMVVSALISLVLCNIWASWWYLLGVILMPFVVYAFGFLCAMVFPPYHGVKFGWDKTLSVGDNFALFAYSFGKLWYDAYKDNCFEREANANEDNALYYLERGWCAWAKYIIVK